MSFYVIYDEQHYLQIFFLGTDVLQQQKNSEYQQTLYQKNIYGQCIAVFLLSSLSAAAESHSQLNFVNKLHVVAVSVSAANGRQWTLEAATVSDKQATFLTRSIRLTLCLCLSLVHFQLMQLHCEKEFAIKNQFQTVSKAGSMISHFLKASTKYYI